MKPRFHNSYNIGFIIADKISKFTSLVVLRLSIHNTKTQLVLLIIFRNNSVINLTLLRNKFNTQTMVISHRWRKWFSSSAGPLFQSVTQRRFLQWEHCVSTSRTKFRGCHPGLLSINFDFPNVIFHPMLFPFVWVKYKWKFMRHCCKLSFPQPLMASPLALLTQIGELARRLCINESSVLLFNGSDKFETGQK